MNSSPSENTQTSVLVLFTLSFPYGNSENFLEVELPILASKFAKVIIVPWDKIEGERPVPENVEIVSQFSDSSYNQWAAAKGNLYTILVVLWLEYKAGHLQRQYNKILVSTLLRIFFRAKEIGKYIETLPRDTIYYSYWFDNGATVLSILKLKGKIQKFVSRAHGFDLYEERSIYNFIPFRDFQLQQVDKVVLISQDGLEYLKEKYSKYKSKFTLSYLGSVDFGLANAMDRADELILVTASRIVTVKRLHLVVDSLMLVKRKVTWIHFGEGPLLKTLQEQVNKLPANVNVKFMGQKKNIELMCFLKNEHVDLFLNVSKSEGLPVTIMEAISFGIPAFATDAGGTREIVNPLTGKLFPVDFSPAKFAEEIDTFNAEEFSSPDRRILIRKFWMENFVADKNYAKMTSILRKLKSKH